MFALLALGLRPVHADDIEYVYDDAGRVVQATNRTAGQAVLYRYDAAGNILSQVTSPLTTLAIGDFSPRQGPAGTPVTISGTGFSTTPSANSVSFNGVAATVSAATTTQLSVTVPASATTGSIAVQVGANTATSAQPFIVTSAGSALTITALIPTLGPVGTPVTIVGTNFDPVPANNRASFNGRAARVTNASSTTVVADVPTTTGSGKVRVSTSRGAAVSPMDFFVVPPGYSAGNVLVTGRVTTDGAAATVALPTASRVGIQIFEGRKDDLLTIGIDSTTFANATLKVFNPDGTLLTSATLNTSSLGVQVPRLPVNGTYSIVVDPGSNTGSITLRVLSPLPGLLTMGGSVTSVSLAPPGRRAALTFAGTQGSFVSVALSGVTLTAGTVSIVSPQGTTLMSSALTMSGLTLSPRLPVSGTYTVLVDPTGSIGGSFNATLQSSSTPTLAVDQPTYNLALTNTSPVTLTFQGAPGQYLALTAATSAQPIRGVNMTIRGPDGAQVTTASFTAASVTGGFSGSVVANMGPLVLGGTYTVAVQQTTAVNGTLNLTLSTPLAGAMTVNGAPADVAISRPGQGLLYTFAGNAGQYLAFTVVEKPDAPGRINAAAVTILKPDGSALASGNLTTTFLTCSGTCIGDSGYYGSVVVNTGLLTQSGMYRVLVQQTGTGQPDTGTLSVTLTSPMPATLTANAPTANVSITKPGQGLLYSFTGTAGDIRAFTISENLGQISGAAITVLAPDGSAATTSAFTTTVTGGGLGSSGGYSGSVVVNIGPLAQTGLYTILLQQVGSGAANTGTLAVTFSSPLTGTWVANGTTNNISITQPGQGLQYAITATEGQRLSLSVSESTGEINAASIQVLATDGSALVTTALTTTPVSGTLGGIVGFSGTAVANFGPLPAGTYVVLIRQTGVGRADTGTLGITLSAPLAGSLALNGTPSNANVTVSGQSVLYTFTGAAGDVYSLAVSENTGRINAATVAILRPDGSTLSSGTLTTTAVPGTFGGIDGYSGSMLLNVGPLPTAGTYSVLIRQTGVGEVDTGTLTLTLSQPVTGTVPPSTPTSVFVSRMGQGILHTFTATPGQFLSLQVSESAGSYISNAQVAVVNPDGTTFRTQAFNPTTCTGCDGYSGNTTLNLESLPQSGTYSILIQQTTLLKNGTGTLTLNLSERFPSTGSTTNYSTSTAGAHVTFFFTATAGQTVGLALTNTATVPSGGNAVDFFLTLPSGGGYTNFFCTFTSSGCQTTFYRVPESGSYKVEVVPRSSVTMSFTATLSTAVGPTSLTPGTPVSATFADIGQSGLFTFTATPGQTLALQATNLGTTPSGGQINISIYNGGSTTDMGSLTTSATTMFNLPNLAGGTYTVRVSPTSPVSSSVQLSLHAGVTGTVATDGTPASFATTAVGQRTYLTFNGTAGQTLGVALTNLATVPSGSNAVDFFVTRPNGSNYTNFFCTFTSASCQVTFYRLPESGTYKIEVAPRSLATMSLTLRLSTAVSTAITLGTPVNASFPLIGQSGLFTFDAMSGQTLALEVANVSTTPSGGQVQIAIYSGTNTTEIVPLQTTSGLATFNLSNLTAGQYTIRVSPTTSVTASARVTLHSGVAGTVGTDSTSASFSTTAPGQRMYLAFQGTAGQTIGMALTNSATVPSGSNAVDLFITQPNGSNYTNVFCAFTSAGCQWVFYRLPDSGTYRVEVVPRSPATMSLTMTLSTATSTPISLSTPTNASLTLGQSGLFTFTVPTAGQVVALQMTNLGTTPPGGQVNVAIYSGASTTDMGSLTTSSSVTFNLTNLGAGTYTVRVSPTTPIASNVQVTLHPGVTGALVSDGAPSNFATTAPSQRVYLTFAGTAGQTVGLALTNLATVPSSGNAVDFFVTRPNASNYTNFFCTFGSAGCMPTFYRLPESGTYKIEVAPRSAVTMTLTVRLSAADTNQLTVGTPLNATFPLLGQSGLFTFTATAGQTFALQVGNISTTPTGGTVTTYVYSGTSTSDFTPPLTTSTSATVNLSNLPAGTYTARVSPNSPTTTSAQVTLHAGVTAALPVDGTSQSFTTTAPSQRSYFTFTANAGDTVNLAMTDLATVPTSGNAVDFTVTRPDGGNHAGFLCQFTTNGCQATFYRLPASGTYKIEAVPRSAATMSFTLTLSTAPTTALIAGTPVTANLSQLGQCGLFTFTATAGQTVNLAVSSVTTVPSGKTLNIGVYSGTNTTAFRTASTTSSTTLNLASLAAGNYTVLISPSTPASSSVQVGYN